MIEILDAVSIPGSTINEDAWGQAVGARSHAVWVLDGATGVAGHDYVAEGPSDAAWLAATLSRHLRTAASGEGEIADHFGDVLGRVRNDYIARVADYRALPSYALPSAAGMWLRVSGAVLDLAWLGDCVAVVSLGGTLHLAGATEAVEQNSGIKSVVAERLAAGGVTAPMLHVLGDELRARRAGLNQPGGFWMFGIEPAAVAGLERTTLALEQPAVALLCSDGFWRLVDHFAAYTPAGLIAAAQGRGLAALAAELRAHEAADPEGRLSPRVKPHDDATAILCRLYPRGLNS